MGQPICKRGRPAEHCVAWHKGLRFAHMPRLFRMVCACTAYTRAANVSPRPIRMLIPSSPPLLCCSSSRCRAPPHLPTLLRIKAVNSCGSPRSCRGFARRAGTPALTRPLGHAPSRVVRPRAGVHFVGDRYHTLHVETTAEVDLILCTCSHCRNPAGYSFKLYCSPSFTTSHLRSLRAKVDRS